MSGEKPDDEDLVLRAIADDTVLKRVAFSYPDNTTNERKTGRRGACVLIAAIMRECHPELTFDRLSQIIFTADVFETVATLERLVGRELPAARNGAKGMPLFMVDLGEFDVVIIRDEWFNGVSGNDQQRAYACWLYAAVLASLSFYALLKVKFSGDPWLERANPLARRTFDFGRDMLDGYWQGFFGYLPNLETKEAFDHLAESVPEEVPLLEAAMSRFAEDSDIDAFEASIYQSVYFLCRAMAVAIGYTDAAKKSMKLMVPQLWRMVQDMGLEGLWADLGDAIRRPFATRQEWTRLDEFLPIGFVGLDFLWKFGIQHRIEGGQIVAEFVPQVPSTLH